MGTIPHGQDERGSPALRSRGREPTLTLRSAQYTDSVTGSLVRRHSDGRGRAVQMLPIDPPSPPLSRCPAPPSFLVLGSWFLIAPMNHPASRVISELPNADCRLSTDRNAREVIFVGSRLKLGCSLTRFRFKLILHLAMVTVALPHHLTLKHSMSPRRRLDR